MSRLIVPQFQDVPPHALGVEVDRSLDVEDIDRAFAEVANVLNGNVGIDNIAASTRFSNGTAVGAVQNSFAQTKSYVCLRGFKGIGYSSSSLVVGVTALSVWEPVFAEAVVVTSGAPTVTLLYGASTLATGTVTAMTEAEAAVYGLTSGYKVSFTSFTTPSVPAGTLIRLQTSVAMTSTPISSASCTFKAGHV